MPVELHHLLGHNLRLGAEYLALFWQSRVLAAIERHSLSHTLIEPYAMRDEEG
jgi:hypothetical protein